MGAAHGAVSKISTKPLPESSLCSKSSKLFRYRALSTCKSLCLSFPCVKKCPRVLPCVMGAKVLSQWSPRGCREQVPWKCITACVFCLHASISHQKISFTKGYISRFYTWFHLNLHWNTPIFLKISVHLRKMLVSVTKCGFRETMFTATSQKLEVLNWPWSKNILCSISVSCIKTEEWTV